MVATAVFPLSIEESPKWLLSDKIEPDLAAKPMRPVYAAFSKNFVVGPRASGYTSDKDDEADDIRCIVDPVGRRPDAKQAARSQIKFSGTAYNPYLPLPTPVRANPSIQRVENPRIMADMHPQNTNDIGISPLCQ
jgi:hypothetical protein